MIRESQALKNESGWLEMVSRIDRGICRLMFTRGPMDVKGVSEKPVVATSESLGERLDHSPGFGIIE